ncbi:sensor histidine kinase [Paenibacillus sp. NPDC058177]|uniref:sensor histidine kinase n=1 Tax=Paenibacillus sp. NPDC058177 TaxID=3346369 RepID=UPI0036DEC9E5
MKIGTRINLLTSLVLIGILLFVDITVYCLYITNATRNANELILSKWEPIVNKAAALPEAEQELLLRSSLTQSTYIRISDFLNNKVYEITHGKDMNLSGISFKYARHRKWLLLERENELVMVVHIPVMVENKVTSGYEIAAKLDGLKASIQNLLTILSISSLIAVLLCLAAGKLVSRTILKPITKSIQTMRKNEESLTFNTIPLQGSARDELYDLTETFNRMIGRLEESFWKQQQFVSDASHELNTMLTIIEGYANMLKRWGNEDQAVQEEAIQSIYEETKRMRKMTRQLLMLASSQQSTKLNLEPVNMVEVCQQVIARFHLINERTIRLHASPEAKDIEADRNKIEQLLIILVDNAQKYSSQVVDIFISEKDGEVTVAVKDQGIGIPQHEIKHVFERFYRVDNSRHRKTGGTGLGLPIAKSIVQEHDGLIWIESVEGEGTTVSVRLPVTSTPHPAKDSGETRC